MVRITWLPMSAETFELQQKYQRYWDRTQQNTNERFYHDTPTLADKSRHSSRNSATTETDTSSSSPSKSAAHSARQSLNEGSFSTNGTPLANNDRPNDPTQLTQAYQELVWKVVQLEASDEDAWKIGLKVGFYLSLHVIRLSNSLDKRDHRRKGLDHPATLRELQWRIKNPCEVFPRKVQLARWWAAVFGDR